MAYKKYSEFTPEEQELIDETCIEENKISTEWDYFEVDGVRQKNKLGNDIKRPSIQSFKKELQEINKQYNYEFAFPNSRSGLHSLTYEIL